MGAAEERKKAGFLPALCASIVVGIMLLVFMYLSWMSSYP